MIAGSGEEKISLLWDLMAVYQQGIIDLEGVQAVQLAINEPKDFPKAMAAWAAAAQVGSVGGPALGGWLTENFNWRWVFYINLPIGILAFLGLLALREEKIKSRPGFDFMGFAALSVALAAFQLMLDRGQQLDWFSSREICIEAIVAGTAFYVFVAHMFTTDRPFLNPGLFKDANDARDPESDTKEDRRTRIANLASDATARIVSKLAKSRDPKLANQFYSALAAGPGIVGTGADSEYT